MINNPMTEIKKLYLQETVQFAIANIPDIDQKTLEKLLDLVNAEGTHGSISPEQLVAKMRLILKYIPGACAPSLTILAELLVLPLPISSAALHAPAVEVFSSGLTMDQLLETMIYDEIR